MLDDANAEVVNPLIEELAKPENKSKAQVLESKESADQNSEPAASVAELESVKEPKSVAESELKPKNTRKPKESKETKEQKEQKDTKETNEKKETDDTLF